MTGLLPIRGPVTVMNTTREAPASSCIIWSNMVEVICPLLPNATTTTGGIFASAFKPARMDIPAAHCRPTAALMATPWDSRVAGAYNCTSSRTESPMAMPGPATAGREAAESVGPLEGSPAAGGPVAGGAVAGGGWVADGSAAVVEELDEAVGLAEGAGRLAERAGRGRAARPGPRPAQEVANTTASAAATAGRLATRMPESTLRADQAGRWASTR